MTDKFTTEVSIGIANPSHEPKMAYLGHFTFWDKLLFRDNLLYVLEGSCQTKVLQECHDDLLVGHFGVSKTLELASRGQSLCWRLRLNVCHGQSLHLQDDPFCSLCQNHFWRGDSWIVLQKCCSIIWTLERYHFLSRTTICFQFVVVPPTSFWLYYWFVFSLSSANRWTNGAS
jgi:hypothetical protein